MARSNGIYAKLREIGEEFEVRWGHPVVILHCQGEKQYKGFVGKTYEFIFYMPVADLKRGWRTGIIRWINEKQKYLASEGIAAIHWTRVEKLSWFPIRSLLRDPSEELKRGSLVTLLWAPAVYGGHHRDKVVATLQARHGSDILVRLRAENKRFVRRYRYAKEELGPRERKHLRNMFRRIRANNRKVLIGVDGAGRPIVKAVSWYLDYLGVSHEMHFLDPHALVDELRAGRDPEEMIAAYAMVLRQEFQPLYEVLMRRPSEVLLIDDQFDSQQTMTMLFDLFAEAAHASHIPIAATVMYDKWKPEDPPPSWHKEYGRVGIRLANKGSLVASERNTRESQRFYLKLKAFAIECAKRDQNQV